MPSWTDVIVIIKITVTELRKMITEPIKGNSSKIKGMEKASGYCGMELAMSGGSRMVSILLAKPFIKMGKYGVVTFLTNTMQQVI